MEKKKEINCQAIFFMGISFVGVGVIFLSYINVGLGAAFIVIGGLNMIISNKHKNTWK
ncbi:hypothetical protein KJ603_01480 [Patescibacteria group bacterium]|nr:hypothetical protein [Patescibacteria group bacterium]